MSTNNENTAVNTDCLSFHPREDNVYHLCECSLRSNLVGEISGCQMYAVASAHSYQYCSSMHAHILRRQYCQYGLKTQTHTQKTIK